MFSRKTKSSCFTEKATAFCQVHGHRLTGARLHILEHVANIDKPLTAYEILKSLNAGGREYKAPTIYRALEFWQSAGFIHRIESLNAYTACHAGHLHTGSQYMVCKRCGRAEEAHLCDLPHHFQTQIAQKDFQMECLNIEIQGVCAQCTA